MSHDEIKASEAMAAAVCIGSSDCTLTRVCQGAFRRGDPGYRYLSLISLTDLDLYLLDLDLDPGRSIFRYNLLWQLLIGESTRLTGGGKLIEHL